ncbi:hypothetical protein CEUSTIGMA_g4912.t1 [Chlamydomonas eustigma]|uniref:CCD97-like C-terminal domain-containing protein n=1 Tax=Chlamydomonas eustigma TaxID=1157962 RepID=A0A250X321_9CHLO|nr:hypothetical protein CEUSTIGMA_g4912.t1 [Chlamydomonas eustigma]|eukprot:GAX77468.1 hypothetical protein CEUSTIGMA_g4912.t1 [Chlamydomonas eustigma]
MPSQSYCIDLADSRRICARLASENLIALPSRMYQSYVPKYEEVFQYLSDLIIKPALFLEKYGKFLHESEVAAFECLRHESEVRFWLDNLKETSGNATRSIHRASTVSRNRRLAAMQKLHEGGEYFSMEAMRERDPELYQQHVGQYMEHKAEEKSKDAAVEEEQQIKAQEMKALQRRAEMSRQQMQEENEKTLHENDDEEQISEHESDNEDEDAGCMDVDVQVTPSEPVRKPLRGASILGIKAGGKKPVVRKEFDRKGLPESDNPPSSSRLIVYDEPMGLPSSTNSSTSVKVTGGSIGKIPGASKRPTYSTSADGASARGAGKSKAQIPEQRHQCGASVDSVDTDLEEGKLHFLEEMEARFLSGSDTAFGVDYDNIDADHLLDDHWIDQRGRDAEDEYFDTVHMEDGDADARETAGSARDRGRADDHDAEQVIGSQGKELDQASTCKDDEGLEEWERMAENYASTV